ncbi:ATP-binding protein [Microbulbifer bruguierae]|uniref:ATP-binding protein n=1 Tax=Microbulbifer bruguierae TaxID=3029061 RepID=A0ABY8NBJ5_9GAMM|nr:ATP-binding protein [Microbulbifer bruguierae]WGL15815.1 ATP-binding protein [Microbulbifer bruguierae]
MAQNTDPNSSHTGIVEVPWQLAPTYILQELELYNWGGFSGHHRAEIDADGTAIIGPTGSGKTTLVDALMTLLTATPKYNLASTGGHESDRDLPSYVRGVTGPGDGGEGQSHIARLGKTVTGIAATLSNGINLVRLGAVLWFDGTSSSPSDMKKLWLFTTDANQTLHNWLTLQHGGGMRALRQLDKTETGIWTYPSKKNFLARARDFFEVRDNAFNLLNRAAGLKQLNSIDDIFRELVLDDTAQFERAAEVADSFDDLAAIHEELEIARRQQRSLEPVKVTWQQFSENEAELEEKKSLNTALPLWFGEQAYRLWKVESERLTIALKEAQAHQENVEELYQTQREKRDLLNREFLQLGGSDIQTLEELIAEKQKQLDGCARSASDYQRLAQRLRLPDTLNRQAFVANQAESEPRLREVDDRLDEADQQLFEAGSKQHQQKEVIRELKQELADIERRPGSNIPGNFQRFRALLAEQLSVSEEALPFVAELVQVKEDQREWRGAIERALGSHRLRILVPPEQKKAALQWINSRHNALHVRILEVEQPASSPNFWEDGYTRKLEYKKHPYREPVKALLAGMDRHCMTSVDGLEDTPHAMTAQGLMSGRARFFDKQDQRRLDEGWLTGFDNRDRLTFLQQRIVDEEKQLPVLNAAVEQARAQKSQLQQEKFLLEALRDLDFSSINIERAERDLVQQQEKLRVLTAPDSDVANAKQKLDEVEYALKALESEKTGCLKAVLATTHELERADSEKSRAYRKAEAGLTDSQRTLVEKAVPQIHHEQLNTISEIERNIYDRIHAELDKLKTRSGQLEKALVRQMSDAQKEDRGALSEAGRELEDVPTYLERLRVLTEEALPEKRDRFRDYLNRSSDDGVSQLLMSIKSEVERIEEKLEDVNNTLRRVDFQHGRYLQLVATSVVHESLRTFNKAHTRLASARFVDDEGESHFKALQHIVSLLRDACERKRTQGARALLDPRYRLEFKVAVIERSDGRIFETRSGSQGGSGGEKEIIASYVLTASLSYALCPDGSSRPLFGTIVLDEAFSRSSHAVAGRIIAALKEFGLHALFITPNKEMRLLKKHTRSAVVVHRRGNQSSLTPLSWQALDTMREQRRERADEIPG